MHLVEKIFIPRLYAPFKVFSFVNFHTFPYYSSFEFISLFCFVTNIGFQSFARIYLLYTKSLEACPDTHGPRYLR